MDLSDALAGLPDHNQLHHPVCAAVVTCALAQTVLPFPGPPSVLHNYWTSRDLAGRVGRAGSRMRDCIRAWVEVGMVPESAWPWRADRVDVRPDVDGVCALKGDRPDVILLSSERSLPGCGQSRVDALRHLLASGFLLSLDFPLHPAQFDGFSSGFLPMLPGGKPADGRHVVVLTGYDDFRRPPARGRTATSQHGSPSTPGAFRFRNSWGHQWGDAGYGWLPYDYARAGLTADVWGVVPQSVLPPKGFGLDRREANQIVRYDVP